MNFLKHTYLILCVLSLFSCKKDEIIKNQSPEKFSLKLPANSTVSVAWNPLFNWQDAIDIEGDAITYSLHVSTDGTNFTSLASGLFESEYQIENTDLLQPDTEYSWKVTATDSQENSTQSEIFSFTTKDQYPDRVSFQYYDSNGNKDGKRDGYVITYNKNNLIETLVSFTESDTPLFNVNNRYTYDNQNRVLNINFINAEDEEEQIDVIYTSDTTFQFTRYALTNPSVSQVISFSRPKDYPRYSFTVEQTDYRGEFYLDDNGNILSFWYWNINDLQHEFHGSYDNKNNGIYVNQSFILNLFPLIVPIDYTLPLLSHSPTSSVEWTDSNGNYVIDHYMDNNTFLGSSLTLLEAIKDTTDKKEFEISIDY